MNLRPYQVAALHAVQDSISRGVLNMLVVKATGLGKTVTFVNLAKFLGMQGRVLILCHTEELCKQAASKVAHWNPDHTVSIEMAHLKAKPEDRFVVASIATLSRDNRLKKFAPDEFCLIIADECHRAVSPQWKKVLTYFKAIGEYKVTPLVGFTATPDRGDKVALASVFDEMVYHYGILEGVKDGWLVKPIGKRVKSTVSLDGISTRAGDFATEELSLTVNTPDANKLIVDFWLKEAENRQTVVFTVDIAHGKALAETFEAKGVLAEVIWGDDKDRAEKLVRFERGETKVLLNCALLIEGWDCWSVACVLMARPTKSKLLYVQAIGRGLRIPPDVTNLNDALARGDEVAKQDCLVLDIGFASKTHTLQSLPSIFGLPPKLDLKGSNVLDAIDEFLRVQNTKPDADLSAAEDLSQLAIHAELVDLFNVQYAPEVIQNSEFQWIGDEQGGYHLDATQYGYVTISRSGREVIRYDVVGKIEGTTFGKSFPTLSEAFTYSDRMVRQLGRNLINLLRREPDKNSPMYDPITPEQVQYLKGKVARMGLPEPDWGRMSKLDGRRLFLKLGKEHQWKKTA